MSGLGFIEANKVAPGMAAEKQKPVKFKKTLNVSFSG